MKFLLEVPYEVKDSAVRDFLKALITQKKMVIDKKRKFFKMKFRSKRNIQSLGIPHKFLKLEGQEIKCFPTFLKENRFKCRERIKDDTRVSWNGRDFFELHVPTDTPTTKRKRSYPKGICSIDPGEKIFNSTYGTDGNRYAAATGGYLIGNNCSKKVDKLATIASRMRNGIERTVGPDGTKEFKVTESKRTRRNLKEKAKDLESRCKHLISDIHRKTVKFLTQKYDKIIIPEFQTKQMATKRTESGKWKRKTIQLDD